MAKERVAHGRKTILKSPLIQGDQLTLVKVGVHVEVRLHDLATLSPLELKPRPCAGVFFPFAAVAAVLASEEQKRRHIPAECAFYTPMVEYLKRLAYLF